ncbi:MAG: HD domain-containing protein [Atopobiaceae bacterium]|jgi:uncharacterized protein
MRSMTPRERTQFQHIVQPYLAQDCVQQMGSYIQHGSVTTLAHTLRVASTCYIWSQWLSHTFNLILNVNDLVAGALLHDLYLYDWHDRSTSKPHHATKHPLYAEKNAREKLHVNEHVCAIIRTHMWPLPPTRVPASKEALLVCVADKWCSLEETFLMRKARPKCSGAAQNAGAEL